MSPSSRSLVIGCLFSGVFAASLALAQAGSTNIPNWTVPPHRNQSGTGGLQTMADISDAAIFVAVTTCRVFDTRDPVGPYGGPRLTANVTRNFDVNSGPCGGIPAGVSAYSMNFGAILPDSAGFITIWDTGSPIPTSSFMNTLPGAVIANAAIIPSSTSGSISVFSNTGVHLYGDVNGYFMASGGSLNLGRSIAWTGNHPADFMFVFNTNTTTSSGFTNAIHGYMTSNQDFVAAIRGEMANVGGANYGVTGVTGSASGNSAGLRAHNGSGPVPGVFNSAGARGETAGNGIGVLGLTSGGGVGVGGYYLSAGGSVLSGAAAGFTSTVGLAVTGNFQATGTKAFIEPHPSDPPGSFATSLWRGTSQVRISADAENSRTASPLSRFPRTSAS